MSEPMDTREEVDLPELPQSVLMRMRNNNNSGHYLEATHEALYGRERQLKAALAANREKDAEIERLKAATLVHNDSAVEAWKLTQKWQKRVFDLEAELSSLRASGGEKWIDVNQELPPMEEDRGFGPCSRRVLINQPVYAILNRPEGCDMWWMDDEENEVHPLEWKPAPPTKDKE